MRDHDGAPARIDKLTIEAYADFLRDCRPDLLSEAMRIAGQRARFFPQPREIRDAYQQLLESTLAGRWRECEQCRGSGFVVIAGIAQPCPRCRRTPGRAGNVEES